MNIETVKFNGWNNCRKISNGSVELIVTTDIGPRIMHYAPTGGINVFAEIDGQQGGVGEDEWLIRGGHRFWIAPEEKPRTYELDNDAVTIEEIDNGIRTLQPLGMLTGIRRIMEIRLDKSGSRVDVRHILRNESKEAQEVAPWAISVMAVDGCAIIPLPEKIPHTEKVTHTQEWSIWGYTDFTDRRWTLGQQYIFFRQDVTLGPNKLGISHREGWVAYQLGDQVFIKVFERDDAKKYPDGNVNFETFSNEEFLELESLGALEVIAPGATLQHDETWYLLKGVPPCDTEADVNHNIRARFGELGDPRLR